MKILLDENFPKVLMAEFSQHECEHVLDLGWAGIKNGQLLAKAEAEGFEILVTLDRNIYYQQNMVGRKLAVFVIAPAQQGPSGASGVLKDLLLGLEEGPPTQFRVFREKP
ncbi:MAG TPA: DUF5615 family PIN-like protein [Fimbriimonadaceae bacterium]|jgi:predicted nuclease of predicted toxin-antitoxin system